MRNRKDILSTLEEKKELLKSLGVEKLGLFGSAARGEWSQRSDLDFIIVLERETFDAYIINNPFRWQDGRELIFNQAKNHFNMNKIFNKFLLHFLS